MRNPTPTPPDHLIRVTGNTDGHISAAIDCIHPPGVCHVRGWWDNVDPADVMHGVHTGPGPWPVYTDWADGEDGPPRLRPAPAPEPRTGFRTVVAVLGLAALLGAAAGMLIRTPPPAAPAPAGLIWQVSESDATPIPSPPIMAPAGWGWA